MAVGLGGCANLDFTPSQCVSRSLPSLLDATDLKKIFTGMARELCQASDGASDCGTGRTSCAAAKEAQTILVTDFANIDTYIPGSEGLLMGELMRSALNSNCSAKIIQAEFGKYYKLSAQGLVALDRSVDEISRDTYPYQNIVVGTYSFHGSKLLMFVRKIGGRTGVVNRMLTREIDYTCRGAEISRVLYH